MLLSLCRHSTTNTGLLGLQSHAIASTIEPKQLDSALVRVPKLTVGV